ncbi:hypothetical protein [Moraxella lacunata]
MICLRYPMMLIWTIILHDLNIRTKIMIGVLLILAYILSMHRFGI